MMMGRGEENPSNPALKTQQLARVNLQLQAGLLCETTFPGLFLESRHGPGLFAEKQARCAAVHAVPGSFSTLFSHGADGRENE